MFGEPAPTLTVSILVFMECARRAYYKASFVEDPEFQSLFLWNALVEE